MKSKKDHAITIELAQNFKGIKVNSRKIRELVRAICKRFELSRATISIAIVDDDQIIRVNRQFLNHDHPTDVISFDLSDQQMSPEVVFELVVNGQLAIRQAKVRGHDSLSELALYITHGLLHNLGYNDAQAKDAKKMHQMEDEILTSLGFGQVYGPK
jgi:probable rRNA maturation factor